MGYVYASKWAVDHLIGEEVNGQIIQTGINKDKQIRLFGNGIL